MKAIQLLAHGRPGRLELQDVDIPTPDRGEVVVEVHACGLNHLDLWLEEGELPIPISLPRTPGCEVAGQISACGPDVPDWQIGDRVAVQSNLFCGTCEFCRKGHESRCLKSSLLGVDRDGGFAENVLVPIQSLVRLPDDVDFETSAALTLAGSTAMHMLTSRTHVNTEDWVLVMGGASGVGSAAIQIARGLGARVITTASSAEKRQLALSLGAHHVVDTNDATWTRQVRRVTRRHGVDVVVEHIGGSVLEETLSCLARGGTIVTCGATAGREIRLNLWPLFVKEQSLIGSYGRTRADMIETLKWVVAGRLRAVIQARLPLAETPLAYKLLRDRSVLGKIVILPQCPCPPVDGVSLKS